MGMGSSSRYSRVRCMAAQSMVVSVGPYMLTTCSPGTAAFHKFTYRACSASPPSAAFFRCVGAYFVSAPEAATRWNAEVAQLMVVTPASSMALSRSMGKVKYFFSKMRQLAPSESVWYTSLPERSK